MLTGAERVAVGEADIDLVTEVLPLTVRVIVVVFVVVADAVPVLVVVIEFVMAADAVEDFVLVAVRLLVVLGAEVRV